MKIRVGSLLFAFVCWHACAASAANYVLDPAESRLTFAFIQAGAENSGGFAKFEVRLSLDDAEAASGRLEVKVHVDSLDTGDAERDEVLRSSDLFHVEKHPTATFSSTRIKSTAPGRYEALGKLTMRGVTRDVRVPFTFADGRMNGGALLKRLDFGVGQGEWQSTEWVGNSVKVNFALRLVPAPAR
jgi:polyisoprenoid-binding protein YceI